MTERRTAVGSFGGHRSAERGSPTRTIDLVALHRSGFPAIVLAIVLSTRLLVPELLQSVPAGDGPASPAQLTVDDPVSDAGALLRARYQRIAGSIGSNMRWIVVCLAILYAYAVVKMMERKRHGPFSDPRTPPSVRRRPKNVLVSFDTLHELDDEIIERAVARVPPSELAVALSGGDKGLMDCVLRNTSSSRGERLRNELSFAPKLSPRRIQQARACVAEQANCILRQ